MARGTVCYVRSILPDTIVVCNIVIAKCHIAGSGRDTIPHMELETALDLIHLSRLVKQELDLHDCPCFFWTDSTIVLHSLRADCKQFPIFPRNRLRRILKYSKIFYWIYVPSKLNPADKASRGLTADDLLRDDVWFSGPGFLKDEPSKWPETIPVASCDDGDIFQSYDLEINVRKCKVANQNTGSETVIVANVKQTKSAVVDIQPTAKLILHFSSLHKFKLAVLWLCRFMQYFVSRSQSTDLSFKARVEADELVIARVVIPGNPDPEFPGFGVFFPIPIPGLYV